MIIPAAQLNQAGRPLCLSVLIKADGERQEIILMTMAKYYSVHTSPTYMRHIGLFVLLTCIAGQQIIYIWLCGRKDSRWLLGVPLPYSLASPGSLREKRTTLALWRDKKRNDGGPGLMEAGELKEKPFRM